VIFFFFLSLSSSLFIALFNLEIKVLNGLASLGKFLLLAEYKKVNLK